MHTNHDKNEHWNDMKYFHGWKCSGYKMELLIMKSLFFFYCFLARNVPKHTVWMIKYKDLNFLFFSLPRMSLKKPKLIFPLSVRR